MRNFFDQDVLLLAHPGRRELNERFPQERIKPMAVDVGSPVPGGFRLLGLPGHVDLSDSLERKIIFLQLIASRGCVISFFNKISTCL